MVSVNMAFSSLRTLEGIIELQASLNDYYAQGLDFVWRVGYLQGLVIWDVMSIILVITGCWGLWKFRKWGLYGLIIVMSASLIIALITPMVIDNGLGTVNYILLGIRLIPIAILYYGVRDKYHYLT